VASNKKKSLGEKIADGMERILDKAILGDDDTPEEKEVPGADEINNQDSSNQSSLFKFSKFDKGLSSDK